MYIEGHRESATTTASHPWGCFLTVLYLVGMIGKCGDQRMSMMETIKKHLTACDYCDASNLSADKGHCCHC